MGYAPAAREDWTGLDCDSWGPADMAADACGQSTQDVYTPRRWVGTQCMTQADKDAHQLDIQAGRLGLPMFHVEQPGVLVLMPEGPGGQWYEQQIREHEHMRCEHARESRLGLLDFAPGGRANPAPDMTEGMGAAALREALAALKYKEDLVRSAPPMSRHQYEQDLRNLDALRANVEREAMRCPPPLVNANDYYAQQIAAKQAEAAAHARQMGEQHAGRMRKRQMPTAEVGRLGLDDAHIEGP
jgi:hypothetical protein